MAKVSVLAGAIVLGGALGFATRPYASTPIDDARAAGQGSSEEEKDSRGSGEEKETALPSPHRYDAPADPLQDPTNDDYDPIATLRMTGDSAEMVFDREPMDEAWAEPMQAELWKTLEGDLETWSPGGKLLDVECRTMICRVHLAGTQEELKLWMGSWSSTYAYEVWITSGPWLDEHSPAFTYHFVFAGPRLEVEDYERYRRQQQARVEEFQRGLGYELPEPFHDEE